MRAQLAFELGPEMTAALEDREVLELLLNPDGQVWVDRIDGMRPLGLSLPPERAESLLGTVAAMFSQTITRDDPILEAILPYHGFRIAGALPPVTSAPVFTIRKPPPHIFPLDELVRDAEQLASLRQALAERKNVLISGATGSGKTTFASSLLRELIATSPNERIVVLEDNPELQLTAKNAVSFLTTHSVSLTRLVRTTLRFHPDRVIVGEVRGAEALDLLKCWNTGHPGGIATVHANSASAALARLDQLAQEANVPSQARLVDDAVDLVIHLIPRCRIAELLDNSSRRATAATQPEVSP
ncbi:MAG TPA: P-type conjugative transfer ATPase TrbB [Thermoanaerobaculia bacterium]|nr:P-type conjugative transfer ATPase TrbB [Thermoanaerobaculia bacterium]